MATEWDELLQVIQLMANTFEFERLLPTITRATRTLLNCTSAHLFLQEPGQQAYTLRTDGSSLLQLQGIENPAFNELLLPLSSQSGERFGILQALKPSGLTFTELERKRAALLAGLAAIAINRQRLWNEAQEKARLEREMRRAHEMVEALIPLSPLAIPGYDLCGRLAPANLTGGDLYDAFPLEDGRVVFLLADATGHGIDSTLLVGECRAIVRSLFATVSSPARVMERANRLLCGPLGREERFVTMFLGALDWKRHRFTYVNGGQSPAILRRSSGTLNELPPSGLPLGVEVETRFTSRCLRLGPGDTIFLATDGLVEWRRPGGEMYGEERMRTFLAKAGELSARQLIDDIFVDAQAFANKTTNQDDVALFVARRNE